MAVFERFEQVARLPSWSARALLADGDPQERVWAAWAVAARERDRATELLVEALASEVDAGVRRHLLVVLAGLGRRRIVALSAAKDFDPHVRATATRYLARLTQPDDAAQYDLIVARTLDVAWWVRYEVADALRCDAPAAVVRAIAGLLFDPDPDVRAAMRRRIERSEFPRAPFDAALEVLRRADRAPRSAKRPTTDALVLYRPLRLV